MLPGRTFCCIPHIYSVPHVVSSLGSFTQAVCCYDESVRFRTPSTLPQDPIPQMTLLLRCDIRPEFEFWDSRDECSVYICPWRGFPLGSCSLPLLPPSFLPSRLLLFLQSFLEKVIRLFLSFFIIRWDRGCTIWSWKCEFI
jgi:hypothetical protein